MGLLHLQQKMREEKEEEVQHRLDVACSPILPPPRTHLPPRIPAHLSSHHTWTPRETYPIAGETYRVGERHGETETFPQYMSRTSLDERTLILEGDDESRDRPTNRHRERDRERELERGREHATHELERGREHGTHAPQWTPRDSGGEADTRDTCLWGEGLSILDIGANLGADTRDLQKVFSLFLNPKP